jgi:SNF2 family DNA or RNA helicase
MQKLTPRMILADEVGLGKTIEAALIVKELLARQTVSRILVICPANLVLQWRQELSTNFNEPFEIVDSSGLRFLGRDGSNGWLNATYR